MPYYVRGRCLLGAVFLCLFTPVALTQRPKVPTADEARELRAQFQKERSAAESEGLVKRFAPEWLQRADELAQQGVAALDAGQLAPARDAFRRARWQIPALPP